MSDRTRTRGGLLAAGIVCAAAVAFAQDRDTLWTKVAADGPTITLSWNKSHPWDALLTSGGVQLVARYFVDGRREIAEPLVTGKVDPRESRTIRLRLPADVRSVPVGPVCLTLQLPDRRVLPIRRAERTDADTAGFRYTNWETQVRRAAEGRLAGQRLAEAERALATASRNLDAKAAQIGERGWTTASACDVIAGPSAAAGPAPFDVVAPDARDAAAQRICINRTFTGVQLFNAIVDDDLKETIAENAPSRNRAAVQKELSGLFSIAFAGSGASDRSELIASLVRRLGPENATVLARRPQIETFVSDWERWQPTLRGFVPQLGQPRDYLRWTSTAQESAFRLFGPEILAGHGAEWAADGIVAASPRDVESLLGAALDAYAGCVEDGRKQLQIKYDNWEALRSSSAQRATSARDFLVRECRSELGVFEKMKADRDALAESVEQLRRAAGAASASTPLTGKASLNFAACGPASPSQPR